jgi:glycosyltransferase involved in cell wall biosynthesis
MDSGYSVLLRTFNCEATLPATLASLQRQSLAPAQYVIVDSGSTDRTLQLVPRDSTLHRYEGREFNYSEALNQGVARANADYTLVISSHTTLAHPRALQYALALLASRDDVAAAYFTGSERAEPEHLLIDRDNFNGFNGLWNTCAVFKTALLRKRGFRPEVFSAEDQEWASWLFAHERLAIARIEGCGMRVENPRKASAKKRLNEYVSIAYFTERSLLRPRNVARFLRRAILPRGGGRTLDERLFDLRLALSLVGCWFTQPRGKSKYF